METFELMFTVNDARALREAYLTAMLKNAALRPSDRQFRLAAYDRRDFGAMQAALHAVVANGVNMDLAGIGCHYVPTAPYNADSARREHVQ